MPTKGEIRKYLTFPMLLIGSGSFFGVIGWMGLAQAADSIIFTVGSSLLSFSGSAATLCGLMSLEITPSKKKINKQKLDIIKHIKLHYPNYIISTEKQKKKYKELYGQLREIRIFCNEFRQEVRSLQTQLVNLDKHLQEKLKDNSPLIDDDSADGIAKKILWSERQIQLSQIKDNLEKLSVFLTNAELEKYRVELTQICGGLRHLDIGIDSYRNLMILCNQPDVNFEKISVAQQKVERAENKKNRQEKRIEEFRVEMETKCETAKVELSLFQQQIEDFMAYDE